MNSIWIDLDKLDNSFLAIWILDRDRCFVDLNKKAEKMLGYRKDELIGKNLASVRPKYEKEQHISDSWREVEENGYWAGPALNRHKNGEIISMERIVVKRMSEEGEVRYISISTEINASNTKEEIEGTLIETDSITGFVYKSVFLDMLEKINTKNKRKNKKTTLLAIDTDKSIVIRDSLGYEARDLYIKEVAGRLSSVLDKHGYISRFTDDQFYVTLFDYTGDHYLLDLIKGVIDTFQEPFLIKDEEIQASVYIGICFYPDDGDTIDALFENIRKTKKDLHKQSKSSFRFFTPRLNEEVVNKLLLENDIRRAIKNNEFELFYQPQYLVKENKMVGFEGLIRWNHPTKGYLTPDYFIPYAEESGTITDIGRWVIQEAMHQIKNWQDRGHHLEINVNLSARDMIQDDLVGYIRGLLEETGINPTLFGIEITETAMINNVHKVSDNVRQLNELGILVGIDDFGTGHSSLSHLIDIPLNFIKIDRSFLFDFKSKKNKAIINLSLSLANELGLFVVAEGVETPEHVSFLTHRSCHYLQGYYFSKPLPLSEIEANLDVYTKEWGG